MPAPIMWTEGAGLMRDRAYSFGLQFSFSAHFQPRVALARQSFRLILQQRRSKVPDHFIRVTRPAGDRIRTYKKREGSPVEQVTPMEV